jgi:Mrp family chromosome partitioning ATPase
MGRTFEILKLAEAAHFSSEETIGGTVLNLTEQSASDPSNLSPAIPYIEIGKSALEGSPDVLSGFCDPAVLARTKGTRPPLHRIPHPQVSNVVDSDPLSVAFRPLNSPYASKSGTAQVAPEIVAFHQPDHPVSKEYEALASAIEAQLPMGGCRVLMFLGAGSEVGTTTVVLNLAFTWARSESRRIVVADAGDVAAGTKHGSIAQKVGLSDLSPSSLMGKAAGGMGEGPEVGGLKGTKQANLFVLCSLLPSDESGKTLSPQAARETLRQLRKQFDLVLIDAPPIGDTAKERTGGHGWGDLASLASGCDGVYLVVPQNAAETPETDELLETIQGQGIHLGGCVLTNKTRG